MSRWVSSSARSSVHWRKLAIVAASACLTVAVALNGFTVSAAYYTDRETKNNEIAFRALHTVTFDANGGTVDASSRQARDTVSEDGATLMRTVGHDVAAGVAPALSNRNVHEFVGWYDDVAAGSRVGEFDDGGKGPRVRADVTYYARWNDVVTFDANGGAFVQGDESAATKRVIAAAGTTIGACKPSNPVRDGLDFAGWFDAAGANANELADDTPIVAGKTYHARWTATVTFHANGDGSFASPALDGDEVALDGATIVRRVVVGAGGGTAVGTLPEPVVRDANKRFDNWYTANEGGDAVSANTQVTRHTDFFARYVDLSGKRVITFRANGGLIDASSTLPGDTITDDGATLTRVVDYGGVVGSVPKVQTRDGYAFTTWRSAATGGRELNVSAATPVVRNYTYYAHWSVEVTFSPNGGSFTSGGNAALPRTVAVDANAFGIGTLPTLAFRSGYVLDGWFTAAAGGTKVCAYSQPTPGATYYAHWREAGNIHYATATVGGTRTLYLSASTIDATAIAAYEGVAENRITIMNADRSQQRSATTVGWSGGTHTRVVVLDGIAPTSCANWFASSRITSVEGLANIDMTDVTTLAGMFLGATGLTFDNVDLADMGAWNVTSKLTSLENMFYGGGRLNATAGATLDLSSWDVSGVKSAYHMFYNAYLDGSLNASTWDLSNASVGSQTGTSEMFYGSRSSDAAWVMRVDMSDARFNPRETSTFAYDALCELALGPGWRGTRGDMGYSHAASYVTEEPSDVDASGRITGTRHSLSSGWFGNRTSLSMAAWDDDWSKVGVDVVCYRRFSSLQDAEDAIDTMKRNADSDVANFEQLAAALPEPSDITLSDADVAAVRTARAAYDALWTRVRIQVGNELVSKLIACEYRLKALARETTAVAASSDATEAVDGEALVVSGKPGDAAADATGMVGGLVEQVDAIAEAIAALTSSAGAGDDASAVDAATDLSSGSAEVARRCDESGDALSAAALAVNATSREGKLWWAWDVTTGTLYLSEQPITDVEASEVGMVGSSEPASLDSDVSDALRRVVVLDDSAKIVR